LGQAIIGPIITRDVMPRSLNRLQTDYIDLYWVHSWDRFTQTDAVMRALDDLVRAGKILQ
jgi:aryl-alcohol dehydrogenase-like predicted oxidoreductase